MHINIFIYPMVIIEEKPGHGLFLKEELRLEYSKRFIEIKN